MLPLIKFIKEKKNIPLSIVIWSISVTSHTLRRHIIKGNLKANTTKKGICSLCFMFYLLTFTLCQRTKYGYLNINSLKKKNTPLSLLLCSLR